MSIQLLSVADGPACFKAEQKTTTVSLLIHRVDWHQLFPKPSFFDE